MRPPALVLAAGSAGRFGAPKQIATFGGRPLVVRAVDAAVAAGFRPFVVLGAHRDDIEKVLPDDVDRAFNARWSSGMASSIRRGVEAALSGAQRPECIAICTCDQPRVSGDDLRRLFDACQHADASAAAYDGIVGVPACFSAGLFDELTALDGDRGARALLRGAEVDLRRVPMPSAAFDVDTPDDLADVAPTPNRSPP